jgi:hypothetical protein
MGIVNGKAVGTIINVRSGTQVTLSKMGLIQLCSSIGVIVDTCEQAALYQNNIGRKALMPIDLTNENKENVDSGLPGIRQLMMRLRYSDCSDVAVVISDDKSGQSTDEDSLDQSKSSDMRWEEAEQEKRLVKRGQ